ncbi:MAG: hypothetical protein BMS9Abin12_0417 [Acidimicrobiia bacterium]|nr:MAG: hypothetical protein BMS9Abin12_0417 [Acidimicrobiia bacterium]
MEGTPLSIVKGHLTADAPLDTAISRAILQRVSDGDLAETLQIGRPHKVVAFGKHDAITRGFDRAVQIALDLGFDPTTRIAGGRAVVFHKHVIRFAWTVPSPDPVRDMHSRFELVAARMVDTLAYFDIGAAVGQLELEYCPGRYSVSIPGAGKVMGSGQRLARRAAQIAGMIVVRDAASINAVLEPVYEALGLAMDPNITASISDVKELDTEAVMDRFCHLFVGDRERIDADIDDDTYSRARGFRNDQDPRILA